MISGKRGLAAAALAALLFAPAALASIPSTADLVLAPPALPELKPASIEATTDPESCGVFCQRLEVRLEAVLFGGGGRSLVTLDAWGNYRNPQELEASKNRFGFTGHLFDRETGTYYAKARYFDPGLGRFLSQDSYLGEIDNPPSLHRFLYAHARPTRLVDPTGHEAFQIEMQMSGYGDPSRRKSWGERFLDAWPGAIATTILEGVDGMSRMAMRVVTTLQRPGSEIDRYNQQIPELRRFGPEDVQAARDEIAFYRQNLGNVGGALDAAQELGPEGSADVVASTTVTTIGAFETGAGLYRAGGRQLAARASRASHAPPYNNAPLATSAEQAWWGGEFDDALRMTEQPLSIRSSGVIRGSGGRGKIYELPGSELKTGSDYIGKTRQTLERRWSGKDHRAKTPSGGAPKGKLLAEELAVDEEFGMEALLAHERGLLSLSNAHTPINPTLPKNAARMSAARKVLEQYRSPEELARIQANIKA